MKRPDQRSAFSRAAAIVVLTVVTLDGQEKPPAGIPAKIPATVVSAAEKIANDPQIAALLKDQSTDAAAKARWNNFLELVRIPSPSREEHLKAAEIHRRLVTDWGFSQAEV
ncbi:MAG TPA: hypothetical protein VNT81_13445, partial [Vicinamibacterales bacterium]|nr:hypothetical protein [Vicinamibacterales bacterium]